MVFVTTMRTALLQDSFYHYDGRFSRANQRNRQNARQHTRLFTISSHFSMLPTKSPFSSHHTKLSFCGTGRAGATHTPTRWPHSQITAEIKSSTKSNYAPESWTEAEAATGRAARSRAAVAAGAARAWLSVSPSPSPSHRPAIMLRNRSRPTYRFERNLSPQSAASYIRKVRTWKHTETYD